MKLKWSIRLLQLALGLMLCAQLGTHEIRASLFSVKETTDQKLFNWRPSKMPDWYRSDNPKAYQFLRSEAQEIVYDKKTPLEKYFALMTHLHKFNPSTQGEPISSDSVQGIRSDLIAGKAANCAHLSWLLSGYLSSIGAFPRVVGFDAADGLGGNGHAVVEVWLEEQRKWMLMDPLNSALFLREGVPLSAMELRETLLSGRAGEIEIRQGSVYESPKERLLTDYAGLIQNITLDGRGDLISRYKNRYGILQFMAPQMDRTPRRFRRAVTNLIGPRDIRVHFLDASARPYHPRRWRFLLLAVLILIGTLPLTEWALSRNETGRQS